MTTVYLHIGRGKTGTTSIQRYLSTHHHELLDRDIHYVLADDAGSGSGHQQFAKSFIEDPPEYMEPAVEPARVRDEVLREVAETGSSTVVLSSENFPLADVRALSLFFENIPTVTGVRIVLFVRSQDELAESEYNQMVKLKRETASFAHYVAEKLADCDFLEMARKWEEVFGRERIKAVVYDGAREDAVSQFLSCLPGGSDDGGALRHSPRSNASVGFKALTAARLFNLAGLAVTSELYLSALEKLAHADVPALFFDSAQARDFRSRFAESNLAFTERFLGDAREDLGGRVHSDAERDAIRARIKALRLDSF